MMQRTLYSLLFLIAVLVFFAGYSAGRTTGGAAGCASSDEPRPVELTRSLFYNPDSMAYYAAVAEVEDDPRALFIAGMAAHLALADPDYPKDIPTVPFPDADYYLLLAAELGNADAITYIRCLDAHGCWHHFVPQEKK